MDVWKSATDSTVASSEPQFMSGVQCVMTSGMLLMLKWPADSWDLKQQVR